MARRKDHTPEALKELILSAARRLVASKGVEGLTARALAKMIGYTPGTIYNFYRDMDALLLDVNFVTLGELQNECRQQVKNLPSDFSKVRALAYAYIAFADRNTHLWAALFVGSRHQVRLPKTYEKKVIELFEDIEAILQDCFNLSEARAADAGRLLWAALHGITVLALDGRLKLVGIENSRTIIDDLLQCYFSKHITGV